MGFGDFLPVVGDVLDAGVSLYEGNQNRSAASALADRNYAMQKEFAQNGIRWRVEDAKAAGIHPLFALGGAGATFSPTSQTFSSSLSSGTFGNMGQDLSRAIDATRTSTERVQARMDALSVDHAELENDLLRSQIARLNSQVGPPLPSIPVSHADIPGVALPPSLSAAPASDPNRISVKPHEVTAVARGASDQAAGAEPEIIWGSVAGGGYSPQVNQNLIQDADIASPPYLMWALRNNILPSLGASVLGNPPPDSYLPSGATGWLWDVTKQAYFPSYARHWYEKGPNFIGRR